MLTILDEPMEEKSEVQKDFEKAVKPLMQHLKKYHNPYATVITTSISSELMSGEYVYNDLGEKSMLKP